MVPHRSPSKRLKKTPPKKESAPVSRVSPRQWSLPVGLSPDGHRVTLSDFLSSPNLNMRQLSDLSDNEQAELTAERIQGQKNFKITLVGVGVLDKEQAIAEVKRHSSAGRTLVEIEKRTLRMVIDAARSSATENKPHE